MTRCFQVHPSDNVATMLEGAAAGSAVAGSGTVPLGHKRALADIRAGSPVIKFGVIIAVATRDIRAGEWVHLHNCRSQVDERSATLDVASGKTTDTVYE